MFFCVGYLVFGKVHSVLSSFSIILLRKKELVALYCVLAVLCLVLAMLWVDLSTVMVAFHGHTDFFVKKTKTYFDKDYRIAYSFVLPSLYNWHPCRFLVDIYHSLDCYLHMAKILKKNESRHLTSSNVAF